MTEPKLTEALWRRASKAERMAWLLRYMDGEAHAAKKIERERETDKPSEKSRNNK